MCLVVAAAVVACHSIFGFSRVSVLSLCPLGSMSTKLARAKAELEVAELEARYSSQDRLSEPASVDALLACQLTAAKRKVVNLQKEALIERATCTTEVLAFMTCTARSLLSKRKPRRKRGTTVTPRVLRMLLSHQPCPKIEKKAEKKVRNNGDAAPRANAPEAPAPAPVDPVRRHKFTPGVCVACQQHRRMLAGHTKSVSAKHGTGGPCMV